MLLRSISGQTPELILLKRLLVLNFNFSSDPRIDPCHARLRCPEHVNLDVLATLEVHSNLVYHVLPDLVGLFEALDFDLKPIKIGIFALSLQLGGP